MKRLYVIAFVLLVFSLAHARNMVIVLDSSGTMKTYGHWQPDAKQAIQSVLTGSPLAQDAWQATGNLNVVNDFRLLQGQSLYFLPFGSIARHEWPFFSGLTKLNSPADVDGIFPEETKAFSQQRTNKSLAFAVAANALGTPDYSTDLIVISDFLIDADMTDAEIRYVNEFEAASTSSIPLILTWKRDPRLQIKLIRFKPATTPPYPPDDHLHGPVVHLVEASRSSKPDALRFHWRIDGHADVRNYNVYVRDEKGRTVFSPARLLSQNAIYPNPVSGKLSWFVIANLDDGTQLKSSVGTVVVPPSSSSGTIFLLLLVLAGAGFVGYQWWRKKGIKEESTRRKSQRTGEM
jgi:hypothetical protein